MGSEKDEQMQLIDQYQTFSPQLQYYLSNVWKLLDNGLDYKIVAIFGSQSSGKSTLLNGMFGTSFAVMRDDHRAQTTRGIWLSKAKDAPFLILDVEGTDGRERGEDQDFERKSALFSMAMSQVLILNMWEHSVGLYNGANMGLLKTVFEVNLSLFQSHKGSDERGDGAPKTLLLFVIRDFLGSTPLDNLKKTITVDLTNIWNGLSKPLAAQSSTVFDFFDLDFVTLPHKVLQPEAFKEQIAAISQRFYDPSHSDYVFNRDLSKLVPMDGLYAYSSAIWEKVRTNKDLDLPTQQELLAQFRCDEISLEVFSSFLKRAKEVSASLMDSSKLINGFSSIFEKLRNAARDEFESEVLRYNQAIVIKKAAELMEKMNSAIKVYYLAQLKVLYKSCLAQFAQSLEHDLKKNALHFVQAVAKAKEAVGSSFIQGAKDATLCETDWSFEELYAELMETMNDRALLYKKEEMKKIQSNAQKEIETELGLSLSRVLDRNTSLKDLWPEILECYTTLVAAAKKNLLLATQGFGPSEEEAKATLSAFYVSSWDYFLKKLKEELSDILVLGRLRKRFERSFKYDHKGLPRLWKPGDDLDAPYKKALDDVAATLVAYTTLDLTSILESETQTRDMLPLKRSSEQPSTLLLISETRQSQLDEAIRRECETVFLDAKRSLVNGSTSIPKWVLLLLLVLGWNELMAVLSSPLYLMILLLVVIAVYSFHLLSLLPMVDATLKHVFETGRQKTLRWVADSALGNSTTSPSLQVPQGKTKGNDVQH